MLPLRSTKPSLPHLLITEVLVFKDTGSGIQ